MTRPGAASPRHGAFFAHHSDLPVGRGRKPLGGDKTGKQDRLISAVYYFHGRPKRFSGGTLRLYRLGDHDASGDFIEFEPEQNSLVVFPSWVRHEVRPVSCPDCSFEDYRFAVNAWLCRTLGPRPGAGGEAEGTRESEAAAPPQPFGLSLSTPLPVLPQEARSRPFDRLRANGGLIG
jgi:hypothetical protein